MSNQTIPYREAKALKKIGYTNINRYSNVASLYDKKGKHVYYTNYGVMYSGLSDGYISAPTYDQVFKWFRDIKNTKWPIETWIQPFLSKEPRKYEAMYWRRGETNSIGKYPTHEEAQLKSLRKLIKITNDLLKQ